MTPMHHGESILGPDTPLPTVPASSEHSQERDSMVLKAALADAPDADEVAAKLDALPRPLSPRVLQELIAGRVVDDVAKALEEDFDGVAREDFCWLNDLVDAGYGIREIAELLVDVEADTPWLYFDPSVEDQHTIVSGLHHHSCVHHVASHLQQSSRRTMQDPPAFPLSAGSDLELRSLIKRQIDESCGFAGIIPSRSPESQWDGQVQITQEDGNMTATVSYHMGSSGDGVNDDLLQRLRHIAARLRGAFGLLQHHHLCCDAFTVLTWTHTESAERVVNLHHISAKSILPLLDLLDQAIPGTMDIRELCRTAETFLYNFMPGEQEIFAQPDDTSERPPQAYHLASLALQMLSIGLLSYSHAHTGPLRPSFLTIGVQNVTLFGSHPLNNDSRDVKCIQITGRLVNLTCMSGLAAGPVLAFQFDKTPATSARPEGYFDVIARPTDVLDTWGPALLVVGSNDVSTRDVLAVQIGGGILSRPQKSPNTLHWQCFQQDQDSMSLLPGSRSFPLDARIRIGAISANTQCPLQRPDAQDTFMKACDDHLHNLGTSRPYWCHKTSQLALSCGKYVVVQAAAGWEKRDGVTVKTHLIQSVEGVQPSLCSDSLEAYHGLEVSLCTGLARRVQLRVLLANSLPEYVAAYIPGPPGWDEFGLGLIDALRGPNLSGWLSTVPREHQEAAVKTLGSLLAHLKGTGIDAEGNLRVACNLPKMINRCFKLRCTKLNAWAKILEDSDHCATFACTTTQCLETPTVKCKASSDSHWRNETQSLTTEVCRHPNAPVQGVQARHLLVLKERVTHSIGPIDAGLIARVRLTDPPTLEISSELFSMIPERVRQRMLFMSRERLRERGSSQGHRVLVTVQAHGGS